MAMNGIDHTLPTIQLFSQSRHMGTLIIRRANHLLAQAKLIESVAKEQFQN